MAKLTHTDLTQLSSNETSAVNVINANGALTETAMENTLSRDGSTPNTMSADIDMNSNKLLNVKAGTAAADGVNLSQLTAATGQVPGLSMTMETTQTDVDQGVGKVWFDAAPASATVLYMDDADTNSADISTFVQTWDDSSTSANRGYIYVIQKGSAVNYALYQITGAVTDATGYTKIPVSYVVGAGTLADTDPVTVNFLRNGDTGATGSTGATGATGSTGNEAGILMAWESTTTDTDQGNGKVWLDNATASSATVLYMDDLEDGGVSINALVDTWDDSSHSALRGTISVYKNASPQNFHIFNVSGAVTSASTYSKIAVTHVASGGTISDTDSVSVQFIRTGDDGAGSGDILSTNNGSDFSSAATTFSNLKQTASTSATGVVELATDAETATGTDTARSTTPANVASHYSPITRTVNVQTGTTYTLVLTDEGDVVTMSNASANTLTIPPNSSVAFSIGTQIDIIMLGAGVTSIAGGTGVTLNGVSTGTGAIDAQYKAVTILKTATDTWAMMGAHGAVA